MANSYLGTGAKLPAPAARPAFTPLAAADDSKPSVEVERVELNKTEQALAGVIIGYESDAVIGDSAESATTVADTLSTGFSYPTGYVFETLRGLGLVYEADGYSFPGQSPKMPGAFIVYAGCDPSKVNQVIDELLLNIARMQGSDADMQLDWFARSKDLITTSDALANETPEAQAMQAALDELWGQGYDYHDKFAERINAVTIGQVRAVAQTRLRKCVVTVSTPAPEKVKVATGKREYVSFPSVDLTPRGVQHDVGGGR
jgi:predicted Zn-dependent peptidase